MILAGDSIDNSCEESDYNKRSFSSTSSSDSTAPPKNCTDPEITFNTAWKIVSHQLAAKLSTTTEIIVAENAGHMVCVDNPQICVEGLKIVLNRVEMEREKYREMYIRQSETGSKGGEEKLKVASGSAEEAAEEDEEALTI
jgi:hypothetical protein